MFNTEIKRIVEVHMEHTKPGDYEPVPFLDALIDNIEDEDEIVHQAITFMIGGFHTSGTMMTWFFYNLGLHPEIQERVQVEIKEALKGENIKAMQEMEKLIYTKQVLNETLRHVKLAPFSERQADKDKDFELALPDIG